ncbi:MAG: hypothetical protein ABI672_13380 [Vicinamibacteria bacterium]
MRRCVKENRYATARLERFWRTLKQLIGYRISFPSDIHDLDKRLAMALTFYLQKPHKGLGGRAPIDVFEAIVDRAARAIPAPRGSPGEGAHDPPLHVRFLDPQQRRLPLLVPAY